jgi:hypothetical protein
MTARSLADRVRASARRANDLIYAETGSPPARRLREQVASAIRGGGRFLVDPALAARCLAQPMPVGSFDGETGIRLPHPTCWFEFDVDDPQVPYRAGLLITSHPRQGWRIRQFWTAADRGRSGGPVQTSVVSFRFDRGRPLPDDPRARALGLHAGTLAHMTRGIRAREAAIAPEAFSASDSGAAIERDLGCTNFELDPGIDPRAVMEWGPARPGTGISNLAGLSIQMTAVLCCLLASRDGDAVTRTAITPQSGRVFRGAATRHQLSYHLLSVALPERIERILTGGTGAPRREHDCRGHWCESRRGAGDCAHLWERETEQRWRCLTCGRKRWWRRAHTRGRRDLGRLEKDYRLTGRAGVSAGGDPGMAPGRPGTASPT